MDILVASLYSGFFVLLCCFQSDDREMEVNFHHYKRCQQRCINELPEVFLIFNMLLESLKAGNYITLKNSMDFFIEEKILDLNKFLLKNNFRNEFENTYYNGLSKCLELKEFDNFIELLEYSSKFNIFIDVKKIPERFELIRNLLRDCLENTMQMNTSALGEIIDGEFPIN